MGTQPSARPRRQSHCHSPDVPNQHELSRVVRYTALARFFSRSKPDRSCLIWSGATNSNGVPVASFAGTLVTVPKFTYETLFGALVAPRRLFHTCENRRCIAPDHLVARTARENSVARQRNHKTAEVIRQIRRLYATGHYTHVTLGRLVDFSPKKIASITRGEQWQAIGGFPDGMDKICLRPTRRLSDKDIVDMRRAYGDVSGKDLARKYNISYIYCLKILNGQQRTKTFCNHSFDTIGSEDGRYVCLTCSKPLQ